MSGFPDWMPITQAQFTLSIVGLIFGLLVLTQLAPDVILIGAVVLLMLFGVLTPSDAVAGMSNEGMLTVAVLFVVGAGVRETGVVDLVVQRVFGRPKTTTGAIARMMIPTTALSGFINNTPLVAMLIPAVTDWARTNRVPASKLMIPLSFAAILGGIITLIGTSTNLVVDGMYFAQTKKHLGMFDVTSVGLPVAIVGCIYVIFFARWLLPERKAALSTTTDPREYTVEMQVAPDGPLVGRTIEQAGLRHLPNVFLAEIDRDGVSIPAVSPQEVLRKGDRLMFVGVVDSVVDLQRIRGLLPATDQVDKLSAPRTQRCLIEAVVSNSCPLVGHTIREGRFRNTYNAVVVAVARNGERLHMKIGDIVLQPGDTLLVEAHPSFADQQRNNRDFFLVSRLEGSTPPRHDRALIAGGLMAAMVTVVGFEWMTMLQASMLTAGLMLFARCLSIRTARASVDWEVLLAIAASLAIGTALLKSGAAEEIATKMIELARGNPWWSLAIVYATTVVITEMVTNNAAAALMFPFALATAERLRVSEMPFVLAVMFAASLGFATPIGYQTNLMVYGPGGYRFSDYLRIGIPLDILLGIVSVLLLPLAWPF